MSGPYFSFSELADMDLPGLPSTVRAIQIVAKKEGWNENPTKYRSRNGKGGGFEYHPSLFPNITQTALAVRNLKQGEPMPPAKAQIEQDVCVSTPKAALRRDAKMTILMMWDQYCTRSTSGVDFSRYSFTELYNNQKIEGLPDWVYETVKSISVSTLKNWIKKRDAGGIGALGGAFGNRKGTSLIDTAFDGAVSEFIAARVLKQPHLTTGQIRDLLRDRFGDPWEFELKGKLVNKPLPNIRGIQRWISQWKKEHHELLTKVTDPDGWKSKYQLALGTANAWVKAPNHLWEIDASPADIILVDGRYNLYSLVDIYTRRIKVLISKTPTTAASLLLIRQAILDWGVPGRIKTDNGSDFVSHQFRHALVHLGIEQDVSPPFTPEHKGTVERHIKTLQHTLMSALPGYSGHNVAEKSKIEARKSFSKRLNEDETSAFDVELTHQELQEVTDAWCNQKYQHSPHGGLNGKTPFEMAASYTGTIRRIENEQALHILFAEIPGKDGIRTVTKKGIKISGAQFWGSGLRVGERVFVRHDPEDIGRIYCFTAETREFICTAENFEALGIHPQEAIDAAKAEQKRLLKEQLAPLRREIKAIKPRDMINSILRDANNQNGNVSQFPTRSEAHATTDLEAIKDALIGTEPQEAPQVNESQLEAARARLAAQEKRVAVQATAPSQTEIKRQKFERALALEQLANSGEQISSEDKLWLKNYQNSPEYKSQRRMKDYEDSGDEAVG